MNKRTLPDVVRGRTPLGRRLLQTPGIPPFKARPLANASFKLSPLVRQAFFMNRLQERDAMHAVDQMLRSIAEEDKLDLLKQVLDALSAQRRSTAWQDTGPTTGSTD